MAPEALCFRRVRPSVRGCVCARAETFFDLLAVGFSYLFKTSTDRKGTTHLHVYRINYNKDVKVCSHEHELEFCSEHVYIPMGVFTAHELTEYQQF